MHKLVTGDMTNLPSRAKTYAITEEGRRRLEGVKRTAQARVRAVESISVLLARHVVA